MRSALPGPLEHLNDGAVGSGSIFRVGDEYP
ncbi:MAG: hypothetical protein JWP51_86 [Bradyrhizobium sp.]|nr:hypothetical protein [Bradyrhizobium sp.]